MAQRGGGHGLIGNSRAAPGKFQRRLALGSMRVKNPEGMPARMQFDTAGYFGVGDIAIVGIDDGSLMNAQQRAGIGFNFKYIIAISRGFKITGP